MGRKGRPRKNTNRLSEALPRRTREHIIADLSVLYFQWLATKSGYVTSVPERDYGYDLTLFTYSEEGEFENGFLLLQVKATDNLAGFLMENREIVSLPIETRHIRLWLAEPMPVILILYEAQQEKAYWLYLQRYFMQNNFLLAEDQVTVSVHIPRYNILDEVAIRQLREFKIEVLRQMKGISLHGNTTNL